MLGALGRRLAENRTLTWVCLVIAVNQLGFGIIVPVTPIYARTFGVGEAAIGLVVAVYGLGRFLFSVPAGQRVPTMTSTAGGRPDSYDGDRDLLIERVGELTEYARSRGVIFGLEVHAATAVSTPARVDEVLGAVDSPFCKLDYDGSHFEVQCIPMEEVIPRVLPWTVTVDIKDQRVRLADRPEPEGWRIPGNGSGRTATPDGRPVEYQWVLGGEGGFALPGFLRLMQAAGWRGAICYETSVHAQQRPDYDGLAAAAQTYRWMADGWAQAGVPTD